MENIRKKNKRKKERKRKSGEHPKTPKMKNFLARALKFAGASIELNASFQVWLGNFFIFYINV
jgi:hypothetical protein